MFLLLKNVATRKSRIIYYVALITFILDRSFLEAEDGGEIGMGHWVASGEVAVIFFTLGGYVDVAI